MTGKFQNKVTTMTYNLDLADFFLINLYLLLSFFSINSPQSSKSETIELFLPNGHLIFQKY